MKEKTNSPEKARLQKTKRILDASTQNLEIFDIQQNALIDPQSQIPVFDFRDSKNKLPSIILKNESQANWAIFGVGLGRVLIDIFSPLYGYLYESSRFRLTESWLTFTAISGWFFYDRSYGYRTQDSRLKFGVSTRGMNQCILRFNFGQTADIATDLPTYVTFKVGSRTVVIDVRPYSFKHFEVILLLEQNQNWVDVSVRLHKDLNPGHHPFSISTIDLYDNLVLQEMEEVPPILQL